MTTQLPTINSRSRAILEAIANGNGYEQILDNHADFTLLDIYQAARDALTLAEFIGDIKSYEARKIFI